MNRKILFLILFAALAMILAACVLIQSAINPSRELLSHQIRQVETTISENNDMLEKLAFHERRLSSAAGNTQLYRLPVLVQGRSTYITVDTAGLDEVSNSLALEELMRKDHRTLKGDFRSGDAAEWTFVLVEITQASKNHLRTTELPEIHKRMEDIRQESAKLGLTRMSLQEEMAKATH